MAGDPHPRRIRAAALCALSLLAAGPARATDLAATIALALPDGARETARAMDPTGPHGVAIGPASPMRPPPERTETGARQRIAWTWEGDAADPETALVDALVGAGFDMVYACRTDACGGFDFRLALPVLPLPDMAVNLADFRYAVGARESPPALAAVLVSAMEGRTHAQLTLVERADAPPPDADRAVPSQAPPDDTSGLADDTSGLADDASRPAGDAPRPAGDAPRPAGDTDLMARLDTDGRAVLTDLDFEPGGTTLRTGGSAALQDLAAWLAADPARRVALVGHTDWTGTPAANLTVSRARAAAVGAALEALGVDPARITVAGAGLFAPPATNATPEGRATNRRVEAVRLPDAP